MISLRPVKYVVKIVLLIHNAGQGPICVSDISNLAGGSLGTRPQNRIKIFGEKKM
jgi:hypothetical protein